MNKRSLQSIRKENGRRQFMRLLFSCVIILFEAAVFYVVWTKCYNPFFRTPYLNRGNYVVTAVYAVLLVLFGSVYGGYKLGYYHLSVIILGLSVTAFLTNCVSWLAIVIPSATWFLSPVPAVLWMTLADAVFIALFSYAANRLFSRMFRPQELLLITAGEPEPVYRKFLERRDRYPVKKCYRAENSEIPEGFFRDLEDADGVVIGDLEAGVRDRILTWCYERSLRTYTLPNISDIILRSAEPLHVFDSPVFLNRNSGITYLQERVKRLCDILLSGAGILVLSPVFLATAAAIRAEDGGPVFFRQDRCTKDGRVFKIIKFRSMIVNADKGGPSVLATKDDPRITKVGRIIRAARIDELPQLFNIFAGDMSVVGPRPEQPAYIESITKTIPEFRFRLRVKGGLTGYAQVYGKYNTSFEDKLKLDLMYIQNYSLLLDLEILLKTIQIIFTKESTEGFDSETARRISGAEDESHNR